VDLPLAAWLHGWIGILIFVYYRKGGFFEDKNALQAGY
jgi:hypothetical protein